MSKARKSAKQILNSSSDLSDKEIITTRPENKKPLINLPNNVINPEIMTYITKVQGERDKTTKKIIIADSPEKKHDPPNQYNGLNDNMNVDKTQKAMAKKGLLYLLNNLSGGSFCPEINIYFDEMKEMKKSELINQLNKTNRLSKEDANSNLTPKSNRLQKDLIEKETPYTHNFKRRKDDNENDDKEEKGFGIKEFREDINQGKKKNNKTNLNPVMFYFNKEKQAKMKIFKDKKVKKEKSKPVSNYINNAKRDEYVEDMSSLRRLPFRNATHNYNGFLQNKGSDDWSSL